MPNGKAIAQAGHAFTNALLAAHRLDPTLINAYQGTANLGTKIALKAASLDHLLRAYDAAQQAGLPCALITDEHHILPPDFTGDPIITALGIGPARRAEAHPITRRFSLIK